MPDSERAGGAAPLTHQAGRYHMPLADRPAPRQARAQHTRALLIVAILSVVVSSSCGGAGDGTSSAARDTMATTRPPATLPATSSTPSQPATTHATGPEARPAVTRPSMPQPSPALPPGPNKAFVLGDSVILGAQAEVPRAMVGWDVTFDAKESRFIFGGLDELKDRVAARQKEQEADRDKARESGQPVPSTTELTPPTVLGRVVVIHLCTNYEATGAFAGWIDRYMAYLKDVERVVWVTCVEWSSGQTEANKAMRGASERYGEHYVVADWSAYARTPGYAYNDGIHLQGPGRAALADLVAAAVGPAPSPAGSTTSSTRR